MFLRPQDLEGWKWKAEHEEEARLQAQVELDLYRAVVRSLALQLSINEQRELAHHWLEKGKELAHASEYGELGLHRRMNIYFQQACGKLAKDICGGNLPPQEDSDK